MSLFCYPALIPRYNFVSSIRPSINAAAASLFSRRASWSAKHLSKSLLNDNGTCNSIAINVYTYLLAFFFFCQLLCLKCTCKDSVHQVTSYAANCFLYSFYSGKGQQRVHIKIKIAFNAAEKNQRSKRIKSRRRRAKGTR